MEIKRSAWAGLFVLFFFTASSQNVVTDTSATAVAYWKKGESKNYLLKKSTEKKAGGKFMADSASFRLTVNVLEETDSSYTIEWRYKTLALPGSSLDIPGIEALCDNLRLVYRTDETGSFTELVNLEEVVDFIQKGFELLLNKASAPAGIENYVKEFRSILSSRESVENLVLKDVQVFHAVYGGEYSSRKLSEDVELSNVFGGDNFPAVNDYQFVAFDKAKEIIRFDFNMAVDKKAASRIIVDFINKTAEKMGGKKINASEVSEVDIRDQHRFFIYRKTGWVQSINSTRLVDAAGSYKKESTRFQAQ